VPSGYTAPKSKELLTVSLKARDPRALRKEKTRKYARGVRTLVKKPVAEVMPSARILKIHDPKSKLSQAQIEKYLKASTDTKKEFPRVYRDAWSEQDEFVRTSFVRDLLLELQKQNLNPTEVSNLRVALDAFSNLRFPTRWSGFKLKDGNTIFGHTTMQHPTSLGTGIWDPTVSSFSKAHTDMDEARIKFVIDAIAPLVQSDAGGVYTFKPTVTLEEVVRTTVIAAGTFTLKYFTLPALADNVDATATLAVKQAQNIAREYVKDTLELMGAKRYAPPLGVVIPKLNLPERPVTPDLVPDGMLSPRRWGTTVTKTMAETAWET
jgi:hypothetical protein